MGIATENWFTEECPAAGSAFSVNIVKKLHSEKTNYQVIDIYQTTHFGNMMVIDGFIMLTATDNFIYHEMMAHSCLFSTPEPKNILIVGGGDCGTLKEVLKHPVESVIQVDIDQKVTELSEKFFPELCVSNNDPRAKLIFEDAIKWIKSTKQHSLDGIIIDSTDPIGPGEGLFTEEFYKNCKKALRENGVIIHQSDSPLFEKRSLSKMRKKMNSAGFTNIETVFFPLPTYPSGWWSATIAGNHDLIKPRTCPNELASKLKYYSSSIHKGALNKPNFLADI